MVDNEEVAVVEPTLHPAVELLLARMKSNPDEFVPKGWRWRPLMDSYATHLTEEEHAALREGHRAVAMDAFHVAVMNELLRDPEAEAKAEMARVTSNTIAVPSSFITPRTHNTAIGINRLGQQQNSAGAMTAQQIQAYNDMLRNQYLQGATQSAYPTTNTTPAPSPTAAGVTTTTKRWGLF